MSSITTMNLSSMSSTAVLTVVTSSPSNIFRICAYFSPPVNCFTMRSVCLYIFSTSRLNIPARFMRSELEANAHFRSFCASGLLEKNSSISFLSAPVIKDAPLTILSLIARPKPPCVIFPFLFRGAYLMMFSLSIICSNGRGSFRDTRLPACCAFSNTRRLKSLACLSSNNRAAILLRADRWIISFPPPRRTPPAPPSRVPIPIFPTNASADISLFSSASSEMVSPIPYNAPSTAPPNANGAAALAKVCLPA